jgi:hypothetical protein
MTVPQAREHGGSAVPPLTLGQLRVVAARLPGDAPQRLRGELRRYIARLEEERSALMLAAFIRSPEQLADDKVFIGELADAYKNTVIGPYLEQLGEVVADQQVSQKMTLQEFGRWITTPAELPGDPGLIE